MTRVHERFPALKHRIPPIADASNASHHRVSDQLVRAFVINPKRGQRFRVQAVLRLAEPTQVLGDAVAADRPGVVANLICALLGSSCPSGEFAVAVQKAQLGHCCPRTFGTGKDSVPPRRFAGVVVRCERVEIGAGVQCRRSSSLQRGSPSMMYTSLPSGGRVHRDIEQPFIL